MSKCTPNVIKTRLYDPNKYDRSKEPQKFDEKILQICQENNVYF